METLDLETGVSFGARSESPGTSFERVADDSRQRTGRPSYVTFILPEYVEGSALSAPSDRQHPIPKPLEPFVTLIAAALALRLPCRPRPWRTAAADGAGRPVRSGEGSENPNDRIRDAANGYLLLYERKKADAAQSSPEMEQRARQHLLELRYWSGELRTLLPAMVAYEAALEEYRNGAKERIMA